jgi:hypothetical protein
MALLLVFASLIGALRAVTAVELQSTLYSNGASTKLRPGLPSAGDMNPWVAFVKYTDANETKSNFGQLYIETNRAMSNNDQTFGAGYVEGSLTAERIWQHYQNMLCQVDCDGNIPQDLRDFFSAQDAWVRTQVQTLGATDPYWAFVSLLVSQFDGMKQGYRESEFLAANPASAIDDFGFGMLNALGDLFDIEPALAQEGSLRSVEGSALRGRPDFDGMSYAQMQDYMNKQGHCSAFIKLTDDMSDIYFGHSSWFVYSAMLRIYKTYTWNLQDGGVLAAPVTTTSFSSYPGMLSSLDDFYMMKETRMSMVQTTNNIFNSSLWDLVVPQSLYAWQRIRSANQLATSGPEWAELVGRYNSGTYNNQYMVLDGKLFVPQNALPSNTLTVVEQIPGLVVSGDATNELEKGYWGSYNVPYHKEIYDKSGYGGVDAKGGFTLYTQYQQAPRAKIFRKNNGFNWDSGETDAAAHQLKNMQHVLRANEYLTDPLADGSPWNAICARGDLDSASPYPGGGYDTKVSSMIMAGFVQGQEHEAKAHSSGMRASIVNGPTSQNLPPFRWSTSGLDTAENPHYGQPDTFDFEFEIVQ